MSTLVDRGSGHGCVVHHELLFICYGFALFLLLLTILTVGWWLPQRAVAGRPSLLIVSVCHLAFLKNWWVKSMLILWQRNQAYLSEDVDKDSRIARGWKSHAIPWSIFLDSGEECYIVKNNLQELINDTSFDIWSMTRKFWHSFALFSLGGSFYAPFFFQFFQIWYSMLWQTLKVSWYIELADT